MLTQQISGVLLTNNPYQVTAHFYSSPTTVNPRDMVLKYLKSVKIPDSSIVYRFLVGLSYLGQMLKIVPLHNILFESILTLGAKLDTP